MYVYMLTFLETLWSKKLRGFYFISFRGVVTGQAE